MNQSEHTSIPLLEEEALLHLLVETVKPEEHEVASINIFEDPIL